MIAPGKTFLEQTAADLMSQKLIVLHQDTSMQEAARILRQELISGAPVVDEEGRCVGVLSATDFLRLTWPGKDMISTTTTQGNCQFLRKIEQADGSIRTSCTLPLGACLLQEPPSSPDTQPLCSLSNSALVDWQMFDFKELPSTNIGQIMTADPVTVSLDTSIRELARMMINAHIHRIIVVNELGHPLGVVSSTDILGAVAYAEE